MKEAINYDKLDDAYELAQTAPSPQLATNHLLKLIIDAGPPKDKVEGEKLAIFLKKVFSASPNN